MNCDAGDFCFLPKPLMTKRAIKAQRTFYRPYLCLSINFLVNSFLTPCVSTAFSRQPRKRGGKPDTAKYNSTYSASQTVIFLRLFCHKTPQNYDIFLFARQKILIFFILIAFGEKFFKFHPKLCKFFLSISFRP